MANRAGGRGRTLGMAKRDREQNDEPIRVARRIFVGNLSFRTSWQDLKDHFKEVGTVLYANVLQGDDQRSKGCGIVEFQTAQEAADAINTLHNSELDGREIFVREDREDFELNQRPESRQRRALPTKQAANGHQEGKPQRQGKEIGRPACKVFVNNLSWQTTWQNLKDHFNSGGLVTHAVVLSEPGGRSKGSGVVEFVNELASQDAIATFNGTELDGRSIYVRAYN